jgi:lysophospholipase L1-like esterase
LLVGELALRISTPETWGQVPNSDRSPWLVDDPILAFANRPGSEYASFRINEYGFRGPELSEGARVQRIACLGDSSTFGLWLDGAADDLEHPWIRFEGYPQELTRLLAEQDVRGVEVVNAGVQGYTSSHGLRQLVTRVLPLAPHVVITRFGLNDHKSVDPRSGRRIVEPDTALRRGLLYGFESWRLARLVLRAWRSSEWLRPTGPRVLRVDPQRFERNLRRFAAISRESGFHLLLLDYPLRPLAWGEHPHNARVYRPSGHVTLADFHRIHARYQALVRRVAHEEGVALLETRRVFARRDDPLYGEWDFVHPNALGAAELARLVLDELVALGWVHLPLSTPGASPGARFENGRRDENRGESGDRP